MNYKTLTRAVILVPLFLASTVALLVGCSEEQLSKTPDDAAVSDQSAEAASTPGERKIKYWVAPMDPTFITDKPGKSPMGMDLVPVYEDEVATGGGSAVSIDPVVVQNMGVRLERVERQSLFRHVRTIGEVEVGEDLVSVVNLRFSGWVEKIHVDRTGDLIEAGQPLFEIYSPDLVASQEEYLLALRSQGPKSELTRSARRKLELFDLDPRDIEAVVRAGQVRRALPIRAPRSGYVLHKNVVEGARIPAGQDLYTIGDLSKVWVKAEVYEHDAPWVEVGQPAQMELTYQKGEVIEGSVAYVYPTLSEVARTLTVRLEFPNPDLRLKPGMFATVYIQFRREDDVLVVPTEAILHSGTREIVFVAVGEGRFEPREITTGLVGDRHTTQVLSGLAAGEVVVTSGQFLIDSESQLQEAIKKMLARRSEATNKHTDMEHDEMLYACPMHPQQSSHEPGRCPICGMDLEQRTATPEELARLRLRMSQAELGAHESTHSEEKMGADRYVCPEHPETHFDKPGRCPIDGTFLEKRETGSVSVEGMQ
jgi:Cu(I)/Ag(I) efflux system membrane fusion protein/cobalt-zinc-cadmium efflux system membrane fusion protein